MVRLFCSLIVSFAAVSLRDAQKLNKLNDQRIKILMGNLEVQKDHHKILELQGAIAELRRFSTLREEAIESLKNVKE